MGRASSKRLGLSDVTVVGEARVNPHAESAESISRSICRAWGIEPPNFSGFVTMSAYLFPRASEERLIETILVHNFLFFIDDAFDRHDPRMQRDEAAQRARNQAFAEILAGERRPAAGDRLQGICGELRERMRALAPESWMRRFARSFAGHVLGVVHHGDAALDLPTYSHLRVLDSGMKVTIELNELANGRFLDEAVAADPELRRMDLECSLYASHTNDLFSYHKEVVVHGSTFNLVTVMMAEHECGFDEAVHHAVAFINEHVGLFEEAAARLEQRYATDADVLSYVEGVREQAIATWHWQISTPRYRSPDSPFPELRSEVVLGGGPSVAEMEQARTERRDRHAGARSATGRSG